MKSGQYAKIILTFVVGIPVILVALEILIRIG